MMPLFLFVTLFSDPAEQALQGELARFPPCVRGWSPAWCEHENYLTAKIGLYSPQAYDYGLWRTQVIVFRDCWEQLRLARENPYGESAEKRMGYLRLLRFYLGDANYLTGTMPPPVPWWRFAHE
jgi:hypothetical protein